MLGPNEISRIPDKLGAPGIEFSTPSGRDPEYLYVGIKKSALGFGEPLQRIRKLKLEKVTTF